MRSASRAPRHVRQHAGAGQQRHAARARDLARRVFQAEGPQVFGSRSDEDDSRLGQTLREADVLRQEAVAGMDGLGAGGETGRDHRVDVEIALLRLCPAEPHGLVGLEHGPGEAIGVGIDRDGRDPRCGAGSRTCDRRSRPYSRPGPL